MSKTTQNRKMTIRMSELTAFRLDRDYHLDGSRSKNEFIEKAIVHALDSLEAEQSQTLPIAIQATIDGRLGVFEERWRSSCSNWQWRWIWGSTLCWTT